MLKARWKPDPRASYGAGNSRLASSTISHGVTLRDDFRTDIPAGALIGSTAPTGQRRLGVDKEGRIGIDGGALRVGCPEVPGWGRLAISYGPFNFEPATCAVFVLLNGHHGSQTRRVYSGRWRSFLRSWATGLVRRAIVTGPLKRLGRFGRLAPSSLHDLTLPAHRTNIRFGLFADPIRPRSGSLPSFSVAAAGSRNGDLLARVSGRDLPVILGVSNVPLCCVVLRCLHGSTYLVGSAAAAAGFSPYPDLRPVAFDRTPVASKAFIGLHQSVLGEVGFTVDTRLYGVAAGVWDNACPCQLPLGEQSDRSVSLAEPVGCIALVTPGTSPTWWLRFRQDSFDVYWELRFHSHSIELGHCNKGTWTTLRRSSFPQRGRNLLIQDDGATVMVAIDGRLVFDKPVVSSVLSGATGLELGPGWDVDEVVVIPRRLRLPEHLVMGAIWQPRLPVPMVSDDLCGDSELARRVSGGHKWQRLSGVGSIQLTGTGARVDAAHDRPNPGRTLHVIEWPEDTVDMRVTITPPPRRSGEVHRGRAGVVMRNSRGDQLVVATYLDDWYVGRSLSSFVSISGEEFFRRAVWTNVDDRISWGRPYTLRVSFDGDRYLARIDEEPVLFRRISDVVPGSAGFTPEQVGLAVNEEFGNDTGSVFKDLRIGKLDGQ